jgi:hypothetical protein
MGRRAFAQNHCQMSTALAGVGADAAGVAPTKLDIRIVIREY